MIFKIINRDKVKIFVEKNELSIIDDIKSFSVGGPISSSIKGFFEFVYEQTGIDFTNSKIMIEVVMCASQSYYINITRILSEERSSCENEVDMYIFKVNECEKLFNAVDIISMDKFSNLKSELYEYKNELYLCIYVKNNNLNFYENIVQGLEKVMEKCKWNLINDSILREWGKLLSDDIVKEITATEK